MNNMQAFTCMSTWLSCTASFGRAGRARHTAIHQANGAIQADANNKIAMHRLKRLICTADRNTRAEPAPRQAHASMDGMAIRKNVSASE
ncbi:hypothetical protein [Andreprevotia chitinilytica]|uniref:hypothetical protein n=1 Tax=Andreprevotia chitinilytica TaxID=396808 RepID=UPI0014703D09|nr:hypothetical protein [Andreprevotia chitinilytica]